MRHIVKFFSEVRHELTKVTWPKRAIVLNYLGLVVSISAIVAIFVGIVDYSLTKGLEYFLQK